MKTIAIMTAYNEDRRIRKTIIGTKKYVDKVIVVDDGSTDNTSVVSKKAGALVIKYGVNRGKGYALRIGLKKAISMKSDIVILLDADGQHRPDYIPKFLEKIKDGYDYVYGKRNLEKYPLSRKIGNFGLTLLTNLLCPTGITDTECGYRALTINVANKISLKDNRYGVEMDFAYSAWKNKFKIGRVNIVVPVFHPKSAVVRGFENFIYIMKRRFS